MSVVATIAAIATVAADLASIIASIKKLKAGGNSPEINRIITTLEKEARLATALYLKQRRRSRTQPRSASGKYT
ncbi:hypothetical protein ES703_124273 [subsurface metagenome]